MNKKLIIGLSLLLALMLSLSATAFIPKAETAVKIEGTSKSAVLIDFSTGQTLYEKNPDEKRQIASMVKIMVLLTAFEDIEAGKASLDDTIVISQNASSMGGSQAFLDANASYKMDELMKSIVVASANDSCVAVAEHLCGSVEAFVSRMNEHAAALGCTNTNFVNCTGLPKEGQYSTAKDVGIMMRELIKHKKFFDYAGVWMYDFTHPDGRITQLTNTNKLIRFYQGCDGGKTGFTNEAMSCLAATAQRNNTRLISIVIGARDSKVRNKEVSDLLNYGFANYETKPIILKDTEIMESPVEFGKQKSVKVLANDDFYFLCKKGDGSNITTKVNIEKAVAPVKSGQKLGVIEIYKDNQLIGKVDAVTAGDVGRLTYLDIVNDMIAGW